MCRPSLFWYSLSGLKGGRVLREASACDLVTVVLSSTRGISELSGHSTAASVFLMVESDCQWPAQLAFKLNSGSGSGSSSGGGSGGSSSGGHGTHRRELAPKRKLQQLASASAASPPDQPASALPPPAKAQPAAAAQPEPSQRHQQPTNIICTHTDAPHDNGCGDQPEGALPTRHQPSQNRTSIPPAQGGGASPGGDGRSRPSVPLPARDADVNSSAAVPSRKPVLVPPPPADPATLEQVDCCCGGAFQPQPFQPELRYDASCCCGQAEGMAW